MTKLTRRVTFNPPKRTECRLKATSQIALARAHVSRHISRRLPYYLTPDEAHQLIDAADNERDRLFPRTLWETGARVSEAIRITLADVSTDGIRVLGKGGVERVIFVQGGLVTAILFYARDRDLERNDFLFPSRKGGHITKQRAGQGFSETCIPICFGMGTPSISSTAGVVWMPSRSSSGTGT